MKTPFPLFLVALLGWAAALVLQFDSGLPAAPLSHAIALLAACLSAGSAFLIGGGLARELPDSRPWERFLIGAIALSIWPLLLGFVGLLSRTAVLLPLFLPVLYILFARGGWRRYVPNLASAGRPGLFTFLVLALSLGVAWFSAWSPVTGIGASAFDLGLADQYLIRGSIRPLDTGSDHLDWLQHTMALMPTLGIDPGGMGAHLYAWFFFAALAGGAASMAASAGDRESGRFAAAVVASSPLLLYLVARSESDILASACVVATIHSLLSTGREERLRTAWGGFFAGAAVAVDPGTALTVVPFGLAFAPPVSRTRLRFWLAALPLPLFWGLRGWWASGEPFFTANAAIDVAASSPLESLYQLVNGAVRVPSASLDAPAGPLLLLLPALGLFVSGGALRRRPIITALTFSIALWFAIGQGQARLLLPLAVALAAVSASRFTSWPTPLRLALHIALAVSLATGVGFLERTHGTFTYLAGGLDEVGYVMKWQKSYLVQRVGAADLPPDARVLLVNEYRSFHLHRRADFDGYREPSRALVWAHVHHDPKRLETELRSRGYTHVLFVPSGAMEPAFARAAVLPNCENDESTVVAMLGRLTPLIRERDSPMGLYEIPPDTGGPQP